MEGKVEYGSFFEYESQYKKGLYVGGGGEEEEVEREEQEKEEKEKEKEKEKTKEKEKEEREEEEDEDCRLDHVFKTSYETLKQNPLQQLKALGSFLGVKRSDEFYEKVVEESAFQNVKAVRDQQDEME